LLSGGAGSDPEKVQIEETKQALAWFDKEFKDQSIIWTGDFNVNPNTKTYSMIVDQGKFVDSWKRCQTVGDGLTFPSDVPKDRIDYVFTRNIGGTCSASVTNTLASDHRPVYVKFVF
jgi:endonuclease/exonuclease/phosphatase family metal-dependent hydrolase